MRTLCKAEYFSSGRPVGDFKRRGRVGHALEVALIQILQRKRMIRFGAIEDHNDKRRLHSTAPFHETRGRIENDACWMFIIQRCHGPLLARTNNRSMKTGAHPMISRSD